MSKNKKIYKIPLLIILVLIFLSGSSLLILRNPSVQTWLFHKFAGKVSLDKEINLSVSDIKFTFFNKIYVTDLLIRDNTSDTLIYAPELSAGIRKVKPRQRLIHLGRIDIDKPVIKLRPDTNDILNIQYFGNLLINKDTAKRNKDLIIRQINITDGRLDYNSGKEVHPDKYPDFERVTLNNLELKLDNFNKHYKNIETSVSEMAFVTDRGFEINNLFTEINIGQDKFELLDPTIRTPNSFINSNLIGLEIMSKVDDFNFFNDALFRLNMQSSLVSLTDLGYFIKPLEGYNNEFIFSGNLNGTVSEINGRDILLSYSDSTMVIGDFDLSGLPDIDNTFMFIDINSLTTTASEISEFNIPGKGRIDPGKEFKRLGKLSFTGNFTGFIHDFVTYGTISSDLGSLSTDILLRPDTSNTFYYNGTLSVNSVDLGKILRKEEILGPVSANIDIDGTSKSFKKFRANLNANIDSLDLMGYSYKNIKIDGLVTERIWDGKVSSNTDNLKMDLLGRFDFTKQIPEVDLSLNLLEADLHALNIDPADTLSTLSLLLTANLKGESTEQVEGNIRLLNPRLVRSNGKFDLYDGNLISEKTDSTSMQLKLRTDYLDAMVKGSYDPSKIIADMQYAISQIFPSIFDKAPESLSGNNDFEYSINFKNTDRLNEFFKTGLLISPDFQISGTLKPEESLSMKANGNYLVYNMNSLSEPEISMNIQDSLASFQLNSKEMSIINRLSFQELSISSDAYNDFFSFSFDWTNKGNLKNQGLFSASGEFIKGNNNRKGFELTVNPTDLYINDHLYRITESSIKLDSTALDVDSLLIERNKRLFLVDGKVSEDPADTITVSFNRLQLAGLNNLEKINATGDDKNIEFILEGLLSGNILLTDVYNNIMFESDIQINDFATNEHELGDVSLLSEWDKNDKIAKINFKNDKDGTNTFNVRGDYAPDSRDINLSASVDSMPLDILNLFLKSFASDVRGYGSGNVGIKGRDGEIFLEGSVLAENSSMTIDYLQTNFNFSDSITFTDNKIVFNRIGLQDNNNNNAVINGHVAHNNFKDWFVDLRIDAEDILAMDTRQKDNSLFYGTAYASGLITIKGPAGNLDFNISAQTEKNTRMFIPLRSGEEINDYSFISFRKTEKESSQEIPIKLPLLGRNEEKSISLTFELKVTPEAEVQLVFDSSLGDAMKATGSGTLNMALNEDGDFTIFGDYVIEDGEYQLTLGNIFNKKFVVEEGGTISWNGDIMDAYVDARAIYKLKASLEDLLQDEAYSSRIPVECHLNMSGQLVNPVIGFDIYLPTADEGARTLLNDMIDSEEDMSRQFLYLLVMNSFYPGPSMASAAVNTTNAGASAMGVTTTEMLSNQLSNWLSQISNDFDIGFTYRPGNEISTQEVEVALSTQLLNDRVVINGNFDVGGEQTTSSTNDISGDFDVEVKLTEKLRFKVFNRSNDNLMYETAPYTQGFGLFYRQSFDKLGDLFKKKKDKMKKEDDPEIVEE
ncbi:MAG: translocation/assembly module TamB [Bacteroidales bacterium]|nr:translocation/assembly module TamB [Bacteroidales bacterium]